MDNLPDNTNLVDHIMKSTFFNLTVTKTKSKGKGSPGKSKSSGKKKTKDLNKSLNDEEVHQFEISKVLTKPLFRCVPDRATMQRLVMRYVSMKDDFKGFDTISVAMDTGSLTLT